MKSVLNIGRIELWKHLSNRMSNNLYICSTSPSECYVVGMYTAIAQYFHSGQCFATIPGHRWIKRFWLGNQRGMVWSQILVVWNRLQCPPSWEVVAVDVDFWRSTLPQFLYMERGLRLSLLLLCLKQTSQCGIQGWPLTVDRTTKRKAHAREEYAWNWTHAIWSWEHLVLRNPAIGGCNLHIREVELPSGEMNIFWVSLLHWPRKKIEPLLDNAQTPTISILGCIVARFCGYVGCRLVSFGCCNWCVQSRRGQSMDIQTWAVNFASGLACDKGLHQTHNVTTPLMFDGRNAWQVHCSAGNIFHNAKPNVTQTWMFAILKMWIASSVAKLCYVWRIVNTTFMFGNRGTQRPAECPKQGERSRVESSRVEPACPEGSPFRAQGDQNSLSHFGSHYFSVEKSIRESKCVSQTSVCIAALGSLKPVRVSKAATVHKEQGEKP